MSTDRIHDDRSHSTRVGASIVHELGRARRAAGTALARRFRTWRRHQAICRSAAALRAMDDAALRDIGLHRSGAFALAAETHDQEERTERNLRA